MWKDDGSNSMTGDGSTVRCASTEEGSCAFNALWCPDPEAPDCGGMSAPGEYCWTLTLLEGEANVGITTAEFFRTGWGCRGFFYGGNVSDGGGLLTQNFGPWPKAGDVIQIVLALSAEKLEMGVVMNGKRLGLAFSVAAPYASPLLPVVSFSSTTGSLSIERQDTIPPNYREREVETKTGIEGEWTPVEGSDLYFPTGAGMFLEEPAPVVGIQLADGGNQMEVSMKMVNRGHITLQKADDKWRTVCPCRMTLMMGPPEMMEVEQKLTQLVQGVGTVELDSATDTLNMTSTTGAKGVFKRYYCIPPTSDVNPLV